MSAGNAHRWAHIGYGAPFQIVDPGASGVITVDRQMGICEVVTAGAEARTLTNPTKAGIRFTLRLKTDGGNATVTAANGLNVAGNTQAVFVDVGDQLDLISVSHTSGYRWEILTNTGSVALSTP